MSGLIGRIIINPELCLSQYLMSIIVSITRDTNIALWTKIHASMILAFMCTLTIGYFIYFVKQFTHFTFLFNFKHSYHIDPSCRDGVYPARHIFYSIIQNGNQLPVHIPCWLVKPYTLQFSCLSRPNVILYKDGALILYFLLGSGESLKSAWRREGKPVYKNELVKRPTDLHRPTMSYYVLFLKLPLPFCVATLTRKISLTLRKN